MKQFTTLKIFILLIMVKFVKTILMSTVKTESLLRELNIEYKATHACLERIPETLFEYKPHPKSMTMGYLTLLVAEIPL
jgi:DNA topoisomerase VI subunit B